MLNCSQYGNPLSYYGAIQYGFYNPTRYKWGAWELPYPQHYQPPLTAHEERVVEAHREYTPQPVVWQENKELLILNMQHEARMKEIKERTPAMLPPAPLNRPGVKTRKIDFDDEDFFILM